MSLDSSLIRLTAYRGTLDEGELKADLAAVLEWVAYARLLIGAVEPGQDYHMLNQQAQLPKVSERYQSASSMKWPAESPAEEPIKDPKPAA